MSSDLSDLFKESVDDDVWAVKDDVGSLFSQQTGTKTDKRQQHVFENHSSDISSVHRAVPMQVAHTQPSDLSQSPPSDIGDLFAPQPQSPPSLVSHRQPSDIGDLFTSGPQTQPSDVSLSQPSDVGDLFAAVSQRQSHNVSQSESYNVPRDIGNVFEKQREERQLLFGNLASEFDWSSTQVSSSVTVPLTNSSQGPSVSGPFDAGSISPFPAPSGSSPSVSGAFHLPVQPASSPRTFDIAAASAPSPSLSGSIDKRGSVWPTHAASASSPSNITRSVLPGSTSSPAVHGLFDNDGSVWPVQETSSASPSGPFDIAVASVPSAAVSGPFGSPKNTRPVQGAIDTTEAVWSSIRPAASSSGPSAYGPFDDTATVWPLQADSTSNPPVSGPVQTGSASSPSDSGPFDYAAAPVSSGRAQATSTSSPPVSGPFDIAAVSAPSPVHIGSVLPASTSSPAVHGSFNNNGGVWRIQGGSASSPSDSGPFDNAAAPVSSGFTSNPPVSGPVQTSSTSSPPVVDSPRGLAPGGPTRASPVGSLSAIAARRAAQQMNQSLVQPEQDVIYKQYNPQASSAPLAPPPTIRPASLTPPFAASTVSGPTVHFASKLPQTVGQFITSPQAKSAGPTITQPPHVGPVLTTHAAVGPVLTTQSVCPSPNTQSAVGPVASSGPTFDAPTITRLPVGPASNIQPVVAPVVLSSNTQSAVGPVVSSGCAWSSSTPCGGKRDVGGLRVFCSIGFGGRLVIGGGRFGHRIATTTLGTVLGLPGMPTKHMIDEIKNCPSALGSVTALTTEHVVSYSESQTGASTAFTNGADAHLLWRFFRSMMTSKRVDLLVSLWQSACEEYAVDTTSPLFAYVARIVEGNLREALQLGSSLNLHAVSMAIASIHSAEFFRESILLFATHMGQHGGTIQESVGGGVLWKVVRVAITAFASTGSLEPLFESSHNQLIKHWKLYLCLVASLVRPDSPTTGGGSAFLLRLGDLLVSRKNVAGGHLCILLSGRRTSLDSVDSGEALISLLGADHRDTAHFYRLLDPGPLQLSEIYEYATRVKANVQLFVPLQPWKYAYASMLACDLGFFDIAEKYIQIINAYIRAVPTGKYSVHFRSGLRELELRIARANSSETARIAPSVVDVGQAALGAIWGGLTRIL